MDYRERAFNNEFVFSASRSGGAGGQNVNKVNTKVELRFNVTSSSCLSANEKHLILRKLANRINEAGELIIISQTNRSQFRNKEHAIDRFFELIEKALKPKKKRHPTKPTKSSKERRLEVKEIQAKKKINRRNIID